MALTSTPSTHPQSAIARREREHLSAVANDIRAQQKAQQASRFVQRATQGQAPAAVKPQASFEPPVASGKSKAIGRVQSIRFESDDGYYILRVMPQGGMSKSQEITIKGHGVAVQPNSQIAAVGNLIVEDHPQWGKQRILDRSIIYEVVPTTRHGIQALLENGYVKGIGPVLAKRLCDAFGDRLFDVAERSPDSLYKVEGMRNTQVWALRRTLEEKREIPNLMSYLAEVGLSVKTSHKVLKALGPGAIDLVRQNPYELMRVPTIGFEKADQIAQQQGVAFDSDHRVHASVQACLDAAGQKGWTYLTLDQLMEGCAKLLGVDHPAGSSLSNERMQSVIQRHLKDSPDIIVRKRTMTVQNEPGKTHLHHEAPTEQVVSLAHVVHMERRAARKIAAMVQTNMPPESRGASPAGAHFAKLHDEQKRAVRVTLKSPVSVLTGRPGCGKTTVTKSLLDAMKSSGLNVLLVGPTNRSAKQMTDATGQRAFTIHRALGTKGLNEFTHNGSNPLPHDVVVLDEAGQTDARMLDKLLQACKPSTSFIMVGDAEQLAPIGFGKAFSDIIDSGTIPVARLTETRRTGPGSSINVNAYRVADRQAPLPPEPGENNDFSMREVRSAWANATQEEKDQAADRQVQAVIDQFNAYRSMGHRSEDIQILTPVRHATKLGAVELNRVMKNLLNPITDDSQTFTYKQDKVPKTFSTGDRIMYVANDTERDIYNGDIGYIREIDHETETVQADFYGNVVELTFPDMSDVDHAYANTVHKMQGGECAAVIMVSVNAHYHMLDRQMLYTGMTRGKKNVCILGDTHRLQSIVTKPGSEMRQTMFDQELTLAFELQKQEKRQQIVEQAEKQPIRNPFRQPQKG